MNKKTRLVIHITTSISITIIFILLLVMAFKTASTTRNGTDDAIDKLSHFYIQEIAKSRASLISDELDKKYETVVSESNRNIVLFADRFPFRYMIDDYGLSYYAAFVGCSSETQASFQTITFLAKKTDEYSLPAVLTIEGETHNIAEAVIQNTSSKDRKILEMNSMQSVTPDVPQTGATYLSVMEDNLAVLKEALK